MSITAKQILESIPQRFRPEKALDYNAVFHFNISGDEPLQYTVTIKNSACQLQTGLLGTADCVIATKSKVYIDLETGKANPQMTLMLGNIKVSNIAAMIHFSRCFRKFEAENLKPAVATSYLNRAPKTGPLSGVKIIDFTRLLPGPLATMFLADLGADVIKVEDPDRPDYIRDFEPKIEGMSMFYLALNRSKRSLAVNYLSPEGRVLIHELVKSSDVLIEQFRPGIMKEMGLGYEELSKLNPRLIYVSITGYGQHSTMSNAAGHDLNYIAIAGALGITGLADGAPVIPGFQLADIAGGSYMAMNAVMAALYQREKTGKGDFVDVSMTDAVLPFVSMQFAYQQGLKKDPGRGKFELSGALPNYNVYACSDGKYVALGSLEPKFWNKFCEKVDRKDWSAGFLKKDEELELLKTEVQQLFKTKAREEWLNFFKNEDICITPVNELSELEHDEYLNGRNMFVNNEHPAVGKYKTINQPLKFSSSNFDNNWNAPDLGDDTASILKELKYDEKGISKLNAEGIIKTKSADS
jgi:crotonobetainyl-CoA:carnitine CoA-transferase CaiB-like acyl-CoA transferase/putative sterol carrier protein